jgi:hypothetical protein
VNGASSDGNFYFGVTFWGESFRHFFLDYCLASLMAERNIPAIRPSAGARFLVCTPESDWNAIQDHPMFRLLGEHIAIEWLPFDGPRANEGTMFAMSRAHLAIAQRMHADKALGIWLYPDTVFSDGAIERIQSLADRGFKAVLAHCPRFANEGFLDALGARELAVPGRPIQASGRDLIGIAWSHMHSETLRCQWDAPWFQASEPGMVWWQSGPRSMIAHSLCWAPLLVDYRVIKNHDIATLTSWTIDGDYVWRNIPNRADIHLETDSDAITLISFTPESMRSYLPLRGGFMRASRWIGPWFRRVVLRNYLRSERIDPHKRDFFRTAVICRGDAGPPSHASMYESAQIIEGLCGPLDRRPNARPTRLKRLFAKVLWILDSGIALHFRDWCDARRTLRHADGGAASILPKSGGKSAWQR